MNYEQALEELKKYNQVHLLVGYKELTDGQKKELLESISGIDLEYATKLISLSRERKLEGEIAPVKSVTKSDFDKQNIEKMESIAYDIITNGEYAVITMAGGQGTRLGHTGPKGTYLLHLNIGDKYIFELSAEQLLEAYNRYGVYIPWYIMTSEANDKETRRFFKEHNYFGYPENKIEFFKQGELPITDTEGNLVLEAKDKVFKASDGNGGVFNAIAKNRITDKLKLQGIKWALITGIDNILVNLVDEMYLGIVASSKSLNGVKSVEKTFPEEKVGLFCKRGGKPSIVEYSELDETMRYAKSKDGSLLYKEANIVNHLLNVELLEKIQNEKLPIHKAYKGLNYVNKKGDFIVAKDPNLYKYEYFIFDYFNFVDDVVIYRVDRNKEFAPLKNREGEDSPKTATALFNALH